MHDLGIYIVSFDRPGYGESDPDPKRTRKSIALDIEELADQLALGTKVYIVGTSMGGQVVWGCLKYIPHRCQEKFIEFMRLFCVNMSFFPIIYLFCTFSVTRKTLLRTSNFHVSTNFINVQILFCQ